MRSTTVRSHRKLSKKSFLSVAAIFVLLLSAAYAATSDSGEIPVKIKAEHLKFSEETGKVYASGSVEARFEDAVLMSDKLEIDVNESIATAEGAVIIRRDNYEAGGSAMEYHFNTDTALVKDFRAKVIPEGAKGEVFLNIKELKDTEDIKTGSLGGATTCDQKDPHTEILAKSFYYKPNDKIVAYSATVYFNGIPVMWLPVYIYDLARRRVSLLMPIIGSNNVEGDFVKTEVSYFVDDGAWGSLYFDFMKKKGTGYGIEHKYSLDKRNSGTLYLYHVKELDIAYPALSAKLDHEVQLEKGRLKLGYDYKDIYLVPSGRLNQTGFQTELSYGEGTGNYLLSIKTFNNRISSLNDFDLRTSIRNGTSRSEYFYSLRKTLSGSKWQNISQGLYLEDKYLDGRLDANLRVNLYRSLTLEATPYDDRLEPAVNLSYRGDSYTAKLSANYFLDIDKDVYPDDFRTEYVERMPDMTVTLDPMNAGGFAIRPEISYGRFHESKYISATDTQRHFMGDRYRTSLGVDRTFALGLGSRFGLLLGAEQFGYDTGDQRYAKRENYTLSTDLGGWYGNSLRFDRGVGEGNSPFFFDSTGYNYNSIRDTMVFYKGPQHRFTLDGGYNYVTNKYFDLLMSYNARPNESFNLNMTSGYNLETGQWRDLVSAVGLVLLPAIKDNLSHTYDLRSGKTRYATNMLEFGIGDSWQSRWDFKIAHSWDVARDAIIMQEASIVKDLHCWETKFTWSEFRKEYKVVFTLKAFPERPVGYASGNQGFFIEGIMNKAEGN